MVDELRAAMGVLHEEADDHDLLWMHRKINND